MLARTGQPLQLALLVDVETDVLMKRITGRRSCGSCGAIYNIYFSPTSTATSIFQKISCLIPTDINKLYYISRKERKM